MLIKLLTDADQAADRCWLSGWQVLINWLTGANQAADRRWLSHAYVPSCSVVSDSFDPMDCSPPGSAVHGDSPGKHTGMGCHTLLQGTFPTQGLNPGLPHCRQIVYYLSHQGSPSLPHFIQMIKDRNCAFSTPPVLPLSPSLTETALLNDIKVPQLLSAMCIFQFSS